MYGDDELPELLQEHHGEHPTWKRVALFIGAGVAILLGIVGIIVPICPASPFFLTAAILLAMASEKARHWINGQEKKLPRKTRLTLRRVMAKLPGHHRRPQAEVTS